MEYEDIYILSFLHYNIIMSYLMEKEINSQGELLEGLINKYIKNYCFLINLPLNFERVVIVASGSSYNAGLLGKYFFENIANVECSVEFASEFVASDFSHYSKENLYIFISQSGQSADTLSAFRKVKASGAKNLCITNNLESPMHIEADYKISIDVGMEGAIAATKTFSASILMLWMAACKTAQNRHINISCEIENIYLLGQNIKATLNDIDNLDVASKLLAKQKDFSIVGYREYYPIARECALKIKETSYINTSSYPLGEFVHGHFALLNKSNVLVTFVTKEHDDKQIELLNKILKTYKTKTIVISDIYEDFNCDTLVKIPISSSKIATILSLVITIQLMALRTALILKRDVDKPKGLNKVVGK